MQIDLYEFKDTLDYVRLIQSKKKLNQAVMAHTFKSSTWKSHTFNFSTKKVETRRLVGERNINWEKTGAQHIQCIDSCRQDLAHFGMRIQ